MFQIWLIKLIFIDLLIHIQSNCIVFAFCLCAFNTLSYDKYILFEAI